MMIKLPTNYEFRPAVSADNQAIQDLFVAINHEFRFYDDDLTGRDDDLLDVTQSYAGENQCFYVLMDTSTSPQTLVGTVALKSFDEKTAELMRFNLNPEYRGNGFGRQLLEWAIHQAQTLGYQRIILESHTKMAQAISLYEKYGFKPMAPYSGEPLSYTNYAGQRFLQPVAV